MLARFENGYFLEVVIENDINGFPQYAYTVYDEDFLGADKYHTEYRSMEMFYPMNEIDYILEFCDPEEVEGEYELLKQKTMEEYEESFEEDPNGEWCLERQGTDYDDIRCYKTEEAARTIMFKEAEEAAEETENSDIDDDYCEVSGEEYFQCWKLYKKETFKTKKEELFNKIELELGRVHTGISQYAWELQDSWVIGHHVEKVEDLIKQLKEMMYMKSMYEIAKLLNYKVTDEQFAEVFALLERMMCGRQIPQIYDTEKLILNMDVDCVCNRLRQILKEIQGNVENGVLDRVLGEE